MWSWRKGLVGIGLACGALAGIGTIGRGGYEEPVFVPLQGARGGAISGRVVDGNGKPLAGLTLVLEQREDVDLLQMFRSEASWIILPIGAPDEISDADGNFRFETGRDDHVVRVHPTERMFAGQTGRIPVRPGFESSGIILRAQPFGSERLISGVVRAEDGAPVGGVHVSAWSPVDPGTILCGDWTDEEGAFTLVDPSRTESALLKAMPRMGSVVTVPGVRFGTSELVITLAEDGSE